jgi:hypothetical protein
MRRNAEPVLPELVELNDLTPANVRAAYVVQFGPRCAAWLVGKFRKRLRRGEVRFHLPISPDGVPPWFDLAVSYLANHRSQKWQVNFARYGGNRHYRIEFRRRLPESVLVSSVV